jgi:hypothetical protein
MIDRRQPDDVSARRAIADKNFKAHSYPLSYSVTAENHLDSRIATSANRAASRWGRSMGPSFIELVSEEFPVADIVVQCPRTGMPVPTGLKTEMVFLRSLPRVAIPLRCPACGQTHKWQPHEAWIAPTLQASAANSGVESANAEASPR